MEQFQVVLKAKVWLSKWIAEFGVDNEGWSQCSRLWITQLLRVFEDDNCLKKRGDPLCSESGRVVRSWRVVWSGKGKAEVSWWSDPQKKSCGGKMLGWMMRTGMESKEYTPSKSHSDLPQPNVISPSFEPWGTFHFFGKCFGYFELGYLYIHINIPLTPCTSISPYLSSVSIWCTDTYCPSDWEFFEG